MRLDVQSKNRGVASFTLIELLVVITIIAILVGLLFPAIGAVKKAANKAKAQTECKSIDTAVRAFYSEYGRLPVSSNYPASANPSLALLTNASPGIIRMLTAEDTANNPRRIPFLEMQGTNTGGVYLDPWDQPYGIYLDIGYSNAITYNPAAPARLVRAPVIVFSLGANKRWEGVSVTTNDDITSIAGIPR